MMMKRNVGAELGALIVMVGSLLLVLITLSGETRTWGIWIAVLSIVGQLISIALSATDDD